MSHVSLCRLMSHCGVSVVVWRLSDKFSPWRNSACSSGLCRDRQGAGDGDEEERSRVSSPAEVESTDDVEGSDEDFMMTSAAVGALKRIYLPAAAVGAL